MEMKRERKRKPVKHQIIMGTLTLLKVCHQENGVVKKAKQRGEASCQLELKLQSMLMLKGMFHPPLCRVSLSLDFLNIFTCKKILMYGDVGGRQEVGRY